MCPNMDQKKLRIWTLFTQCKFMLSDDAIVKVEIVKTNNKFDNNIFRNTFNI